LWYQNVLLDGLPLVSFRIYDIDGDEYITRKELTKNITKIVSRIHIHMYTNVMFPKYNTLYNEDQSDKVKAMVKRIFEDIDENGDEQLVSSTVETRSVF
jgi:Ca2+-binding EF-hand superfamily protein